MSEDTQIIEAALRAEGIADGAVYDDHHEQIIIFPKNLHRTTVVLKIQQTKVQLCNCAFDLYDPQSIPKIAKAIKECANRMGCEGCTMAVRFVPVR